MAIHDSSIDKMALDSLRTVGFSMISPIEIGFKHDLTNTAEGSIMGRCNLQLVEFIIDMDKI